jgi:hypothetical protein
MGVLQMFIKASQRLSYLCGLATILAVILVASPARPAAAQDELPPANPPPKQSLEEDWEHSVDGLELVMPQSANQFVAASAVDTFGYSWSEIGYAWTDIAGQGPVAFNDPDDGFGGPLNIGFDFKFYENTYNQLFVSTDGFLTFESGVISTSNQPLPQDIKPNNLIAALWMDLNTCPETPCVNKVFTKQLSSPARFVIQWNEVVRYGTTIPLTFQVILYQSGDVELRYKTINGELGDYTVGIEDRDGADGLTAIYNGLPSSLASGKAIRFVRPAPAARVKITPAYQSGFAIGGQAVLHLQVHNTGDLAAQDTFSLQVLPSDTGWKTTLVGGNSTGPLPAGSSKRVSIRFEAPLTAKSGDYVQFQLKAVSTLDPSAQAVAPIQVAVPAPFAQALSDDPTGMRLDTIWEHSWCKSRVSYVFTGNTLSVGGLGSGNYVYLWERNGNKEVSDNVYAYFTNIEYVVLGKTGWVQRSIDQLTHTDQAATATVDVVARYPSLAAAPDGTIGIAWVENRLDRNTVLKRSNIFFAIMDRQGRVIYGPLNLTNSTEWLDRQLYRSPVVAATSDNRYFISWMETRDSTTRLFATVRSSANALLKAPTVISQESGAATDFLDPVLTHTADQRVFAAYTLYEEDPENPVYRIMYGLFDSGGNLLKEFTPIAGSTGLRADAVQATGGNIFLAWSDPSKSTIAVTVIHSSGNQLVSGPFDLPAVGTRRPDYVSLTRDSEGRAVLTWMDFRYYDYLFYALLDGEGGLLTPSMIFATGSADEPLIQSSFASHGNAPYLGAWDAHLPVLSR